MAAFLSSLDSLTFTSLVLVAYLAIWILINRIFGRARLTNGIWFFVFLVLLGFFFINVYDHTQSRLIFDLVVLTGLFVISLPFIIILIIFWQCFFNGIKILIKEGVSLRNCLAIFLGLLIIVIIAINMIYANQHPYFLIFLDLTVFYFVFLFFNYLLSSFVYRIYKPMKQVQYIIVLGCGLLNGNQVSPLLAGRINRAIAVYRQQTRKGKQAPILIMSGGQGSDETVPESHAMRDYAILHHVDPNHILVEDQSINTYQNMAYSKAVILEHEYTLKKVRILFTTTDYHVFRSALYARKVRMKAQGLGSKTVDYYRFNARLREYIAILQMHWKSFLFWLIVLYLLTGSILIILNNPEIATALMRQVEQILRQYFPQTILY